MATLYLSACSKPDPVIKPEITNDTSVTVETTTVAATETEDSSEVNPDDFYANFKPLTANVFDGNMIACEPEIYA